MANKIIKTTFYVKGEAVWAAEWYESLSNEKIDEHVKNISEMGYGNVDALTDTTGRMITLGDRG